ncbi:unnamed protein product [Pedinophyceae sp. YPF-701]|nr:unnamed protein product [Pedinophyceae sp. YPF-701]
MCRDSKPGGGGAADKLKEQLDKMTYELSVALQEKEAAVENEASLQARLARVNEAHQEAVQGRAQAEGKAEELRQSLLRMTEARELHRNRVTSLEEMLSYLDTYMSMVPPSHRPKISLEEYAMNNRPEDAARPTSSAAARGLQRTGSKNLARGKVPSNGEPLSRAASMRASGGSGNSQDKAMAPSATTGRTRAASEAATAPGRTSAAEPADGNPVYSVGAADYTQKKKTVAAHQVPPRRRATHAAEQPHPAPVKELSRVDEESAMQAKASQRNMSFRVKPDPDGVQEQRDALRRVLSKKISSRGLH